MSARNLSQALKPASSSLITKPQAGFLQRQCACGTHTTGGQCQACQNKQANSARSAITTSTNSSPVTTTTSFSASRSGYDFSRVRASTRTATNEMGENEAVDDSQRNGAVPADIKTETQDGGVVAPDAGGARADAGGADAGGAGAGAPYCSVTGSFSSIPSGAVAATMTGNKLGAAFRMIGDFNAPNIPCTCHCGEYRQYVRGYFKANGRTVTHSLGCGRTLSASTFQEDGCVADGTAYGHRSLLGTKSRFTVPPALDMNGGCRFEGADEPGIASSTSGTRLEINLDFQGKLIDTCRSDAEIASSAWTVSGTATVP